VSAAQWLIVVIGAVVSTSTFMLMRYPQHRREEYRGEPFSAASSLTGAAVMLALCLLFAWIQGQSEVP
jgi:hypothetical protein